MLRWISIGFMLIANCCLVAQQVQLPSSYSNMDFAKLYYNPANFGNYSEAMATIYRNQYPRYTHTYNHIYLEGEWLNEHWCFGGSFNMLLFSTSRNFDLGFDVGYRFNPYGKDSDIPCHITIAGKPVFKFHTIVQNPGTEQQSSIGRVAIDFDAGATFQYHGLRIGAARVNLLQPEFNFLNLYYEQSQYADNLWFQFEFPAFSEILMQLNVTYTLSNRWINYTLLNVGAIGGWADKVQIGGGYKIGINKFDNSEFLKAAIVHLGFKSEGFIIRYSYDIELRQDLPSGSGGSHEIGLVFFTK